MNNKLLLIIILISIIVLICLTTINTGSIKHKRHVYNSVSEEYSYEIYYEYYFKGSSTVDCKKLGDLKKSDIGSSDSIDCSGDDLDDLTFFDNPRIFKDNNLFEFRLQGSRLFTGEFPTNFGFWNKLRTLFEFIVRSTGMTGTIPDNINLMYTGIDTGLLAFDVSDNYLSGELPQDLSGLKRLREFKVSANKLSGEIPENLFNTYSSPTCTLVLAENYTAQVHSVSSYKDTLIDDIVLAVDTISTNGIQAENIIADDVVFVEVGEVLKPSITFTILYTLRTEQTGNETEAQVWLKSTSGTASTEDDLQLLIDNVYSIDCSDNLVGEIREVDLSNNNFEGEVPSSIFNAFNVHNDNDFGIDNELRLNNNSFTRLSEDLQYYSGNIWLGNNPWICDCKLLSWFGDWASANPGKLKDWSDTVCANVNALGGTPVATLRADPETPCSASYNLQRVNVEKEDPTTLTISWQHEIELLDLAVWFEIDVYKAASNEFVGTYDAGWIYPDHQDKETLAPTSAPSTPTIPTFAPTSPTIKIQGTTKSPTKSSSPSSLPTIVPSNSPTIFPTYAPTDEYGGTNSPTAQVTSSPTDSFSPTQFPVSSNPTMFPTFSPSSSPTKFPTNVPSSSPITSAPATYTISPTATFSPTLSYKDRTVNYTITGLEPYTDYRIVVYASHKYYDGIVEVLSGVSENPKSPIQELDSAIPILAGPYTHEDIGSAITAETIVPLLREFDNVEDTHPEFFARYGEDANGGPFAFVLNTIVLTYDEIEDRIRKVRGPGSVSLFTKTNPYTPDSPPVNLQRISQTFRSFSIAWDYPVTPLGPLEYMKFDVFEKAFIRDKDGPCGIEEITSNSTSFYEIEVGSNVPTANPVLTPPSTQQQKLSVDGGGYVIDGYKEIARGITSRTYTLDDKDYDYCYLYRVRAVTDVLKTFNYIGSPLGPLSNVISMITEKPCPPGKFINAENNDNCDFCPLNTYNEFENSVSCSVCPTLSAEGKEAEFKTEDVGADSKSLCVPPTDFLISNGSLLICPEGAICGVASTPLTIEIEPEFWRPSESSLEILECPTIGLCLGFGEKRVGETQTNDHLITEDGFINGTWVGIGSWQTNKYCKLLQRGPLCESCDIGYRRTTLDGGGVFDPVSQLSATAVAAGNYTLEGVTCVKCDTGTRNEELVAIASTFIIGVGASGAMFAFVLWWFQGHAKQKEEEEHQKQLKKRRKSYAAASTHNAQVDFEKPDGKIMYSKRATNLAKQRNKGSVLTMERQESTDTIEHHDGSLYSRFIGFLHFLQELEEDLEQVNVKLKIIFGAYQVASAYLALFYALYPDIYLQTFEAILSFFNFNFFNLPVGCVLKFQKSQAWLLVVTVLPILACLVILIEYLVFVANAKSKDRVLELYRSFITAILIITFAVYPAASSAIFSTYSCQTFDDGSRALFVDYTVDCDSPNYNQWFGYAIVMTMIYPIGIVLLYVTLLYKNIHTFRKYRTQQEMIEDFAKQGVDLTEDMIDPGLLLNSKEYETLKTLSFLWDPYRPKYYWFEVAMLLIKLIETSVVPLLYAGESMQVLLVCFVTFFFLAAIAQARPYLYKDDNTLANVSQICLFFMAFGAFIRGHEVITNLEGDVNDGSTPIGAAVDVLGIFLIISTAMIGIFGLLQMFSISYKKGHFDVLFESIICCKKDKDIEIAKQNSLSNNADRLSRRGYNPDHPVHEQAVNRLMVRYSTMDESTIKAQSNGYSSTPITVAEDDTLDDDDLERVRPVSVAGVDIRASMAAAAQKSTDELASEYKRANTNQEKRKPKKIKNVEVRKRPSIKARHKKWTDMTEEEKLAFLQDSDDDY